MTARFWRQKPPAAGTIVTASTGRKKETRFAKLRIKQITVWDPEFDNAKTIEMAMGYTLDQIAEKEGFSDWTEFTDVYVSLNQHLDPDDAQRKHYFIEFELLEKLNA